MLNFYKVQESKNGVSLKILHKKEICLTLIVEFCGFCSQSKVNQEKSILLSGFTRVLKDYKNFQNF